jgi:putative transposase
MRRITDTANGGSGRFQRLVDTFLAHPGLPFADILPAEEIERVFAKHDNLFGTNSIYSTVITLWAFLGQVLRDGKEAACQSAVAGIVTHQQRTGGAVPTADTGDYCRARAKLFAPAVREAAVGVGGGLETKADDTWLWKGRHAKLADGFTFTMPDTPDNRAAYPQPRTQKKGVGFPIARACVLVSLATACVLDLTLGPYAGKETGETALLRAMIHSLLAGDVLVADRFYCSFLMIALLMQGGVDVCARMHQGRHVDFRRGRRLGKYDHLITWTKPARPAWMDEETYAALPEEIELREIRFNVVEPGRRVQQLTIVTTLTDAETYSKEDIAELYAFRWNVELDIRSIKQSLGLDHVRCKSPEMVRRELWTTLLGYNLIRTTAAAAALLHNKQPRQISFTGACQYVLSSWMLLFLGLIPRSEMLAHAKTLLSQISQCEVANRPGRLEPRVLKRRRHRYPLMQEPRANLRAELMCNK